MTIADTAIIILVGMTGFEPATSCSQSRCATKLRYIPVMAALKGIEPILAV